MRFDLFDAMTIMKKHFGNDGEILLIQNDNNICVRLITFISNKPLSYQFEIDRKQINDSMEKILNRRFKYGVETLKYEMNKQERIL